jgi:hypothetical protein
MVADYAEETLAEPRPDSGSGGNGHAGPC